MLALRYEQSAQYDKALDYRAKAATLVPPNLRPQAAEAGAPQRFACPVRIATAGLFSAVPQPFSSWLAQPPCDAVLLTWILLKCPVKCFVDLD